MKNKLTLEELKLQSKLNEAEFAYQESHWAEMGQIVSKKSIWAKYGTTFKAAVVFVAIVGSVVVLKEFYPTEPKKVSGNKAIETIQSTPDERVTPEQPSEQEKSTTSNTNAIAVDHQEEVKSEIPSSIEVEQKINQLNSKELELVETIVQEELSPEEATEPTLIQTDIIEIQAEVLYVKLESAPCLNEKLFVRAVLKEPKVDKNITFKWFINGASLAGNDINNSLTLTSSGAKQVVVKAYSNDKLLSEGKNDFTVESKLDLSFTATDLDDLFYDQNVNLKVDHPIPGSYRWYVDQTERIQFSKETAWTFLNEGQHDMTLEHVSPNGCISKTTQSVEMKKDFIEAFPNSFTPDNDGINDVFVLTAFQGLDFKSFRLVIVNHKGEVVFQTTDPYEGWNNRLQNSGNFLPSASYAWSVQVENNNGRKKTFKGKIKTIDF